jgi:hypothetical protein
MSREYSHLEGSGSSLPNEHRPLRAFARVVRLDPQTGTEAIDEHEFIRIELAVAWVQVQLGTFRAIRGEAFFRDAKDHIKGRVGVPKE